MSAKSNNQKPVGFLRTKKVKFNDLIKEVLDEEEGADSCMQVLGDISTYEYEVHDDYVIVICQGFNGSRIEFKLYYTDLCKYFFYTGYWLVKDKEFEYIVFWSPYNG